MGWHRASDLVMMAEIFRDGTLTWNSNFRFSEGDSHKTRVTMRRHPGEVKHRLEVLVDGNLHSAKLMEDARGVHVIWSDKEKWVRGFDAFAGAWYRGCGTLCANIFNNGRLFWNTGPIVDSQLYLTPSGKLMLHQQQEYLIATINFS